jgi:hypothetical protein
MTSFEDTIWRQLVDDHDADQATVRMPAPRRRPRLLLLTTGTAALAAVTVVVVVLMLGASTSTPPAYAVTDNHNGTVSLMIRRFADPGTRAGVNQELAQLGVHARVVPIRQDCPAALNMPPRYTQPSTQPWSQYPGTHGRVGEWTVGIIPSRIPPGHTLVFAVRQQSNGWMMADAIVRGYGPSCTAPAFMWGITH